MLIFVGGKDRMRFGSLAVHKQVLAAGGKSTYVELPGADHIPSARRGWSNRKHVAWLLSQHRRNNPAPGADPHPGGVYPPKRPTSPGR